MAISWFIFDVGHSFTLSFLTEESISIIRLSQTHNFIVKFTKHLFIFIVPLTAAILGSLAYKGHGLERIISILLIIFMASWAGNKGPIIMIFLVLFVSYATFANKKINIKTSISILIFIPLLLFLIYKIVLFQYSSMTDPFKFLDYFYQRVFIAQMIGVYEEFNLFISDPSYLWHGIPFASFLVEFPQFHKDLMMISEDRFDSASIGIKNTLFIAEAYGMGGIFLLIFSPIIMAVNFALTYIWMVIITNKMVIKNLDFTKKIIAISLFSYIGITGGFSDLMLFKITMLITLLILPFLFFHYFFLRSKH